MITAALISAPPEPTMGTTTSWKSRMPFDLVLMRADPSGCAAAERRPARLSARGLRRAVIPLPAYGSGGDRPLRVAVGDGGVRVGVGDGGRPPSSRELAVID